jgi:flagellar basal-body rod protein FlgG
LKLNNQGLLCASDGSPVLNTKGQSIALGPGKISISEDGSVSLDNNPVASMKIVTFNDLNNLVREGNSLYLVREGKDQEKASTAKIKSGYLEQSNVNAVSSMVRMIGIMRQFESLQKTIHLVMNDMNTKVIDKLGR